ncbi:hypothetical protein [Actinomadura sp. 7K507]|uniref:hypothetical protein n=1 Tax=Actinomadura sp. 7K507 TaxID=2530365 RepID=UPI00104EB1FD|nr:hypothetical protein [Actinomadura sp. 7K507]TDC89582.1 hypothetical protein E1285_16250 [Actinomadura sp. 7K507]
MSTDDDDDERNNGSASEDHTAVVLFVVGWIALVVFLALANSGDESPPGYEGPDVCYGRGGAQTC